jgi:hypothetical protein
MVVVVGETCAHGRDGHSPKRNWHLDDESHTLTKGHSDEDTFVTATRIQDCL